MAEKSTNNKPAAEATPTTPPAADTAAATKSRTPLLVGGGIVAVLAVLVGAWLLLFQGPSSEDYKQAYTTTTEVRDSYASSQRAFRGMALSSSYSSKTLSGQFEERFNQYKDASAKLKDLKAIQRDNELKEKYEAFAKKNEKFISQVEASATSLEKMQEVSSQCNNVRRPSIDPSGGKQEALDKYDKAVSECKSAVESLKEAKSKAISELGTKGAAAMKSMREALIKALDAAEARDSDRLRQEITALRKEASEMNKIVLGVNTSFSNEIKAVDPDKELNELGRTVTSKYNQSKK